MKVLLRDRNDFEKIVDVCGPVPLPVVYIPEVQSLVGNIHKDGELSINAQVGVRRLKLIRKDHATCRCHEGMRYYTEQYYAWRTDLGGA